MEDLLSILNEIKPGVDFKKEKNLITDEIIDSFDIVTLIASINDKFNIDFPVSELVPENFSSASKILETINKVKNS